LGPSDKLVVPPKPPQLIKPDSALLLKCIGPVDIGTESLTQGQLERLWITDRERLLSCVRRHAALRDFYADRDAQLSAKPSGGKT
jgi:hypothetical protein